MTGYNTGTTATGGSSPVASVPVTIPLGVLVNDVVYMVVTGINNSAVQAGFSVATTGTPWAQVGTVAAITSGGWSQSTGVFRLVAKSIDVGLAITVNVTGANCYTTLAMASYTGFSVSSPEDVSGSATAAGTASVTCPAEVTTMDGDWAVYLGGATESSSAVAGPAGSVQRQNLKSGANVAAVICDSGAGVGPAGTGIGGGTFSGAGSGNWWGAFTIGLATSSPTVSGSASLAAAASLSSPVAVARAGTAHLSSAPALAGAAMVTEAAHALLSAASAASAQGLIIRAGAARLSALASAVPSARVIRVAMAALGASPSLLASPAGGSARPDALWTAYQAAQLKSGAAWEQWRMMRQAGGTDGTSGFLFGLAYEAQQAAEAAYEAWRRAWSAEFPGATG